MAHHALALGLGRARPVLSAGLGCDDDGVRTRAGVALVDLLAVLVFVLVGRRSHDEASAVVGTVATAWPFVTGAAVGQVVVVATRRPPQSATAGVIVTAATVMVGMGLRRLTGGGTPASFVVVATTFLALFLLGWRLAAGVLARRGAVA
jgi:hypothetical protein